jgi:phosphoadenosine phosphosulfate reductase
VEREEPILTDEDRRQWALWERTCRLWAGTPQHRARVDRAREALRTFALSSSAWRVMWSGGKDSTALVHLAAFAGIGPVRAVSVKDDLDFPGEEAYVRALADRWAVDLEVLHPPTSLIAHIASHEERYSVGADIHGREADLSRVAFYPILRAHHAAHGPYDIALGLRAAESRGRTVNRATRGITYRKADGQATCQPIADWADRDVYAYLFAHDVPILPLYRCVRLAEAPGRVRKSWWLPGKAATQGGTIWLRTYYPSLFAQLRRMLPQHGQFA